MEEYTEKSPDMDRNAKADMDTGTDAGAYAGIRHELWEPAKHGNFRARRSV